MMYSFSRLYVVFFLLMLYVSSAQAEFSDEDKVKILTEYLIKQNGDLDGEIKALTPASPEYKAALKHKEKITIRSRNEAIATIYGKPRFHSLVYDEHSEMFFGRIISENGNFERDINFYMPKKRARDFKKKVDTGRIEIKHVFDDNEVVFKEIELEYKGVSYPLHVELPNSFTLKLGGYFVGIQNTEISTTKDGLGATLNLQEFFNTKQQVSVGRVNAIYKFNPNHRVEGSWYSLNSSSSNSVSGEFIFDGTKYQAGADVGFYFDTAIYKINYIYSMYRTNKMELSFRAGLHITSVSTGLTASYDVGKVSEHIESDNLAITAPLPVFGLGLGYEIIPSLNLNYTIDYFALSYDSTVSGAMVDSLLSLDYKFNRYIGVGGGVNMTEMSFKGKTEGTEFKYNDDVAGVLGYLILSY